MRYPPRPIRCEDIEKLLELLRAVVTKRGALYVSAPITSGRRLTEWHIQSNGSLSRLTKPDYQEEHLKKVVEPNRAHAAMSVLSLREKYPTHTVIDPTAVGDLKDWTQDDYRYFWGEVIIRYVSKVVFVDGWQFSSGCAYEFIVARRHGIETTDEEGRTIELEDGRRLLTEAATGVSPESAFFLTEVLDDLSRLTSKEKDGIHV